MVMAVCMGITCMSGCGSKDIPAAQEEKINITEKGNDESNMRFGSNGGLITAGDEKIYYIMVSDKDYRKGDLMVMNEDGTQEQKICSLSNNKRCLNYMDGYLYYVKADGDYDSVVKMKADGSEETVLFKEKPEEKKLIEYSSYNITQLIVLKSKIITRLEVTLNSDAFWYVYDCENQTNAMINNEMLDLDDAMDGIGFNNDIQNMIFENDWVYYCKHYEAGYISEKGFSEIKKTRYDGTEDSVLFDGQNLSLYGKIGDKIIYSSIEEDEADDTNKDLWNKRLKIYDSTEQKDTLLYEEKVGYLDNNSWNNVKLVSVNIWKDQIYYVLLNPDNNKFQTVHQVNISTKEDSILYEFDERCRLFENPVLDLIGSDGGKRCQFAGNWLYIEGYSNANFGINNNTDTYKIKLDGSVVEKVEPVV